MGAVSAWLVPNQGRENTTAGTTPASTGWMAAIVSVDAACDNRPGPAFIVTDGLSCQARFLLAFFSRTNDKYRQIMISRWCAPPVVLVLATLLAGSALTPSSQTPAKADYSQEAAVIEEMSTKIAFDNDGNLTHEQTSRI